MGKKSKKWYVVIIGTDVGVFETWSEASSHTSGIPGALHESFNNEEEARRIFIQERDKGNTKVVSGRSPQASVRVSNPSPTLNSPMQAKTWAVPSESGRSSPRPMDMSPTDGRAPPPTPVHSNVTYIRGPSSSPNFSPRSFRPTTPRAVVRTPPDIVPYPSGSDETPASPTPSFRGSIKLKTKQSIRHESHHSFSTPISPKTELQGAKLQFYPHAVVQTPSYVGSFQSSDVSSAPEDTLSQYPSFRYTPEEAPPPVPMRPWSAEISPLVNLSKQSQCRHTCPNCGPMVPACVGYLQTPLDSKATSTTMLLDDPRSPMLKAGHFKFVVQLILKSTQANNINIRSALMHSDGRRLF
ncbi:hypothetical protein D9615_002247 [Tricholomella constricta]|uniref:Ribonuclease H1 N-terminal domain-containing protein n=1 Tax=Tricholomella constricta TaxID=117010 RepID=A0A8H5M966_9AGAR|nr:hypothetical protein D9615_002247 [Tricholomella constricta]